MDGGEEGLFLGVEDVQSRLFYAFPYGRDKINEERKFLSVHRWRTLLLISQRRDTVTQTHGRGKDLLCL